MHTRVDKRQRDTCSLIGSQVLGKTYHKSCSCRSRQVQTHSCLSGILQHLCVRRTPESGLTDAGAEGRKAPAQEDSGVQPERGAQRSSRPPRASVSSRQEGGPSSPPPFAAESSRQRSAETAERIRKRQRPLLGATSNVVAKHDNLISL